MKTLLKGVAILLACLSLTPSAYAQAANGNGGCADRILISYYKIIPGRQDEWLALYQKWHHRVMQYEIAHGMAISTRLYETGSHSRGMPWDFAIIIVLPPKDPAGAISRPDLIRKLYPDLKAYIAAEKERWALTVDHWDETLVEMNMDKPLSVYAPVDGFCKRPASAR
ncbi:MAG TPA: hypothetical protein VF745_16345 [Steroidobacteraceae bacterium]